MRTTVIPAQITTVEDKIAGNLSLNQILILMGPIFWTTIVYVILPPKLDLAWYKLPIILIVLFACLISAIRIKGKLVLNWFIVLLKFNLRPKYYLFDKNDAYLRDIDLPILEYESAKQLKKTSIKEEIQNLASTFDAKDLIKLEKLIKNPRYSLSFKTGKKGEMHVGFEQVQ